MKPQIGDLVNLGSDINYYLVETINEGEKTYHCLLTEDQTEKVYCVEALNNEGLTEWVDIEDEQELELIAAKFDVLLAEAVAKEGSEA